MRFTKMQSLGNDFVVIDGVRQSIDLDRDSVRWLADRHFGVGCDQVLLVQPADSGQVDFVYRIWNADGGEVAQCGNGARCFAKFVRETGLTDKASIQVRTSAGMMVLTVEPDQQVTVNMGIPEFVPAHIPFTAEKQAERYDLDVNGTTVTVSVLALGNPHAVQLVENVENAPVTEQGPLIEGHPMFPQRVNAGYMQILDRDRIKLRVYERGAGETLACGSGACAAVVAGRQWGLLDENVAVELRGGQLQVRWAGVGEPVYMTGPAETVFEGEWQLPD
jgi:diaminopimelate epimerase